MQKPGLGQRLVERIKAKGYEDPDSKFGIRVTDWALDHRYPPGSVFKWIGDVVVPDYETILRLARDLDASPGWLHYGDDTLHGHGPSRGKAPRRQGRRTVAGSLLLALTMGAASLLGWPSPSDSAAPSGGVLPSGGQLALGCTFSDLVRRFLAQFLPPVWRSA